MTNELTSDRTKFWSGFFKDFYGVGMVSHPVSDELLNWSAHIAMQASLKATLDCARAFATTDFRPDLPAFSVPTLVIHGDADKTVPLQQSEILKAKYEELGLNVRLVVQPDGGHGLWPGVADHFVMVREWFDKYLK